MAATPWMNSDQLIASIKRKIFMPVEQNTFTDVDLLSFVNDEMMVTQVPKIMSMHEEYFTTVMDTPIVASKSTYQIPDRALGGKLRDVFYKDGQGSYVEMSRIEQDERAFFQYRNTSSQPFRFYFQGSDIVVVPDVSPNPAPGFITFVYHLRPNQLVTTDRAATITGFSKTLVVSNASLIVGNTVTVGSTTFTAVASAPTGNQFAIGVSSTATAANLAGVIALSGAAGAVANTATVTLTYPLLSTSITSVNSAGIAIQNAQGVVCSSIPTNITAGTYVDVLQTKGGHRTLAMDLVISSGVLSGNTFNFPIGSLSVETIVGDYICQANECIIPQIPSDLHIALVERVCARIATSLGDTQALATVNQKLQEIEATTGNLIGNRADGAPKKFTQRKGILRLSKAPSKYSS